MEESFKLLDRIQLREGCTATGDRDEKGNCA